MSRSKSLPLLLALVMILGALVGIGIGCRKKAGSRDASGRRILYYVDTMHPQYKSDKPGTAPDCGMPLSPVYADEVTPAPAGAAPSVAASGSPSAGRKVLYWYDPMAPGSRFDKPGKSPFMDMPLVPRYADEPAAATGASASAAPPGASVALGADAIRATGIATVPVERGELSHEIRAVGRKESAAEFRFPRDDAARGRAATGAKRLPRSRKRSKTPSGRCS